MNYKGLLPFIFFITTLSSVLNAQEMNDELKKRLREENSTLFFNLLSINSVNGE